MAGTQVILISYQSSEDGRKNDNPLNNMITGFPNQYIAPNSKP